MNIQQKVQAAESRLSNAYVTYKSDPNTKTAAALDAAQIECSQLSEQLWQENRQRQFDAMLAEQAALRSRFVSLYSEREAEAFFGKKVSIKSALSHIKTNGSLSALNAALGYPDKCTPSKKEGCTVFGGLVFRIGSPKRYPHNVQRIATHHQVGCDGNFTYYLTVDSDVSPQACDYGSTNLLYLVAVKND